MTSTASDIARRCGQLIVGGFDGTSLPRGYERALRDGRRGGAILFRRNVGDVESTGALCRALTRAAQGGAPPFIGVDQEGGRVVRLGPPVLSLPPMRTLGDAASPELITRAGAALGSELSAIGFNIDFAPVLDVDSNPDNPIIGDRSFARTPERVAECAVAFARGLETEGVMACGKHFPGHGDTSVDSHVDLPIVPHGLPRLREIELPPFHAAAKAGIASMMTAHVVCEGIDPGRPATMSPAICTQLLREAIGFGGVLFSDDLEMDAVAARQPIADAAVSAMAAGCDVLLVCAREDRQEEALEALIRESEKSATFRARCEEARHRSEDMRRRFPLRARDQPLEALGSERSQAVARDIAALAAQPKAPQPKRDQETP